MRVAHVITRLIVGGAQENTLSTVLGLHQKSGVTVRLYSGPTTGPEGSLEPLAKNVDDLFHLVPKLVRPVHPIMDFLAYRHLVSEFKQFRPNIVHTHSGKAGLIGRLAAKRVGVPMVIHSIHGPSFGAFQGCIANAVFSEAERIAGTRTDHFITVANAMSNQYLSAGIGNPEDYTQIFSGFELDPFLKAKNSKSVREKYGLTANDFVIGKIARLFELKGHEHLFAIAPSLAKRVPNMRFLLVGDGVWREKYESLAKRIGCEENFVFTGLVPPEQIPELVGMMDGLIHLSRREGLPRALPQAMAAAKPVVAFDCDGASEVCIDRLTGMLIPPDDLAKLEESLIRLAKDVSLRKTLGQAGQAFVKEKFTVERLVEEQYQLYRRLLSND